MNVHDHLKDKDTRGIRRYVTENALPASVAMHNVEGNLNLGSIIRTANFLGMKEVLYFGRRRWDRRGAVGTYNYTELHYFESEEEFVQAVHQRRYNLVALENNLTFKPKPLSTFVWPRNPCILVGEEGSGLTQEILDECYDYVEIPGRGSVRSLNVSVAASLAMYDISLKIGK